MPTHTYARFHIPKQTSTQTYARTASQGPATTRWDAVQVQLLFNFICLGENKAGFTHTRLRTHALTLSRKQAHKHTRIRAYAHIKARPRQLGCGASAIDCVYFLFYFIFWKKKQVLYTYTYAYVRTLTHTQTDNKHTHVQRPTTRSRQLKCSGSEILVSLFTLNFLNFKKKQAKFYIRTHTHTYAQSYTPNQTSAQSNRHSSLPACLAVQKTSNFAICQFNKRRPSPILL